MLGEEKCNVQESVLKELLEGKERVGLHVGMSLCCEFVLLCCIVVGEKCLEKVASTKLNPAAC